MSQEGLIDVLMAVDHCMHCALGRDAHIVGLACAPCLGSVSQTHSAFDGVIFVWRVWRYLPKLVGKHFHAIFDSIL
jgi:hypothetical protein